MRRWNHFTHFFTNSLWRRPVKILPRDPLTFQVNIYQLGKDIDNGKFKN